MASSLIRLRRTLSSLSGLQRSFSATSVPPFSAPTHRISTQSAPNPILQIQSRSFRSSSISLLSTRSSSASSNPDEIGPDTILFEGCDYNHWLFVMDFPKDNKPSPEEMVRVYEETCAKGLNISVEEAKKKMYACSTTTYTGFQAVMTEEESKKFEDLPGVIFVLPDSYIDPVNKQYGGDQYINGTIIPRPPPIQYGRNQGARRDRQRSPGQYDRQENPTSNPQGNFSYNNRGPMQGDGRNYGPPQNYPPQQNHGQAPQNFPPRQNYGQASHSYPPQENHSQAPQNFPPQQNYGQASQSYPPQQNHSQAQQNFTPQQNYGQASQRYPPQQNYGQASQNYPPQQNYGQASQNYTPHPQQQTYGHTSQQRHGPAPPQYAQQQSFGPPGQGERRNYVPQQNFGLPGQGERRDPAPRPGGTDASQAWDDTFTPSYMKDFKPSYMEERRDPAPRPGGTGASQASDDTFTPSYMKDFKPSYMEEFERAEQGNHPAKEQTGSQQRYPPPGQGNFTGEGRY